MGKEVSLGGLDTFIKIGIGIAIIAVLAGLSVLGTPGSTAFESMKATFFDMLPVVGIGVVAGIVFAAMRFSGRL